MREQTKKMYRMLPWAVAVGLVIAIGMALSYFSWSWLIDPWNNASRIVSQIAINEFGEGIPDMNPYWIERISILAGVVILFVIGPSLWIFSEIKNQAKKISSKDDELKKGFVWYAGVMIVITGLLLAVQGTVKKGISFNQIWNSADKSRNIDQLRSELMTMAFEAAELYYLTYNTSGDGGFQTVPAGNGEIGPIGLEDLESHNNASPNSFVLAPVDSDSVVTIYGVGYEDGADPDFENANGDRGKVQVTVNVVPNGKIVQFVSTNTN